MMVCQRTCGMFVCCIQVGAFGTCYFFKYRVLYCCTTNQCHIIRASIMIITVQTVWIGKVCVHTAKAIGSFIHKVCKSRNTARYIVCYTVTNFIGRSQHDTIETLFNAKLFPYLCFNIAGTIF